MPHTHTHLTSCIFCSKRSVWSKLLGKRTPTGPGGSLPHSKSWSNEPRKPRRPDPHEWSIPNPPPLPTVEYLMGKSRVAHKLTISLKEELQQSVWGRDAYDDENDGSESDQEKTTFEKKQLKLKPAGGKRKKKQEVDPKQKKSLAQRRQVTPIPSLQNVQVPKSDFLSKPRIQPVRVAPPPPTTSLPPPSPIPPPIPPMPSSPVEEEEEKKIAPSAPIAKAASARGKKPLSRQDTPSPDGFANQLQQALTTAQGQQPKAVNHSQMQRKITPVPAQMTTNALLNRPKLQRQPAIDRHSSVEEQDSDDSSFTSSSEEETESSDDDSSDYDSDEGGDRPIMARNMGIHGARIAKEVMQRMKNQRYPSIFLKPIITLDTIAEVRYEILYEAVS